MSQQDCQVQINIQKKKKIHMYFYTYAMNNPKMELRK